MWINFQVSDFYLIVEDVVAAPVGRRIVWAKNPKFGVRQFLHAPRVAPRLVLVAREPMIQDIGERCEVGKELFICVSDEKSNGISAAR
jgi:hypothetical protein